MNVYEALNEMINEPSMANAIRACRLVCCERDEGTLSKKWADKYLNELTVWIGQEAKDFRLEHGDNYQ